MNNQQIDNTDYYRLPCGKYLEDFIWYRGLNFAWGSALKYLWRAGHKDGESKEKDMNKCMHYVRSIAKRNHEYLGHVYDEAFIKSRLDDLYKKATEWSGVDMYE